ncbi:hypothetical protein COO60DRAFT_1521418 [Scenedesmus sp. NREL 46B-D3]|nr:hypothetical protein COO60DRAFT_1521418 [Scenedesmus sp. NREL 46B-D3]
MGPRRGLQQSPAGAAAKPTAGAGWDSIRDGRGSGGNSNNRGWNAPQQQQQPTRGWPGSSSNGAGSDRQSAQAPGNGRGTSSWGNRGRNNQGDRASLGALTGSLGGYQGIQARRITATGTAGTLAQGLRRRGNARAAAQSLAQAYSSGQAEAAAQAVAAAATDAPGGAADSAAVAEAVAEATVVAPKVAPALLAKSAGYAVQNGQTGRFANTMAGAFGAARRRRSMPQFTTAVASAIATGGAPTRYAYGQAIATAIAQGGDGQAAVAEATATAICAGGSTASAWASAYAVALSQDSRGCLVLNQAKAMAKAQCGNGASKAFSDAEATSTVLGFCGLLDLLPGGIGMGWAGGNSGSNSGNAYGGLFNGWGGN